MAKSVTGGVFMHVWDFLDEHDVLRLPVTRRFGSEVCQFLRATCKTYARDGYGIYAPDERPGEYSEEELRMVPATSMRFVFYENMKFYVTFQRGLLENKAMHLGTHANANARIGACLDIWLNVAHEALSFLTACESGKVRLNEHAKAITLDFGDVAVATIMYYNDVLYPFNEYKRGLLADRSILQAYSLPLERDYSTHWLTFTTDTVAGENVFLSQFVVLPRIIGSADTRGNLKCPGRRTVAYSRAIVDNTTHMVIECLNDDALTDAWTKHHTLLLKENNKYDVQRITSLATPGTDNDSGVYPMVSKRWLGALCLRGWTELVNFTGQLQTKTAQLRGERFSGRKPPTVFESLSLAESITRIVRERYASSNSFAGRPTAPRPAPVLVHPSATSWVDISRNMDFIRALAALWSFKARVLAPISYVFSSTTVTIAVLVLDKNVSEKPYDEADEQVQQYVDMSRAVGCAMWSLWDAQHSARDSVFAGLVPHKVFSIGNETLRHCRSSRQAFVFARGDNRDETIMYNYIGGGVSYQPKHTFSLVYKSLPREQARRLCALWHYLLDASPKEELFVRKQNTRTQEQLSLREKRASILDEMKLISDELCYLRRRKAEIERYFSPRLNPINMNVDAEDL